MLNILFSIMLYFPGWPATIAIWAFWLYNALIGCIVLCYLSGKVTDSPPLKHERWVYFVSMAIPLGPMLHNGHYALLAFTFILSTLYIHFRMAPSVETVESE